VKHVVVAPGALLVALLVAPASFSSDIIDEWGTVKAPPKPDLKAVTVDPRTTALLILDLGKGNCAMRPRCVATVPNVKKLHDAARAAGTMLFYTGAPADFIDPSFAPREGEWVVQRGPDKFLGSDLEARLKAKGITTVIVCGTSAQGVVIGTGSGSAQRGYKVIVPVDCMSSEDPYMEQYAAWHMFKGGPAVVTAATTLTRSNMIKF
jgi:nicotinamidase-related amidase